MTISAFPALDMHFAGYRLGDIALGTVNGMTLLHATAQSDAVTSTSFTTVWGFATPFVPFPVAEAVSVVSSSSLDTLAGTGAQKILITYLDVNGDLAKDVVEMNGTTPVITSALMLRVAHVIVLDAGSTYVNQGDITLIGNVSGLNARCIRADEGVDFDGVYSVPRGHKVMVHGSTATTSDKTAKLRTQLRVCTHNGASHVTSRFDAVEQREYVPNFDVIQELTDIAIEARVVSGSSALTMDPIMVLIEIEKFISLQL